jgi:hypothetical protein
MKKLLTPYSIIIVLIVHVTPLALAQTSKYHRWGLPDSSKIFKMPEQTIASIEVKTYLYKRPAVFREDKFGFEGTLERAIYHITGKSQYWTRFKEKPPLTYLGYSIGVLFPQPTATAMAYIKGTLERRYKFRMYDIQDTVSVYVLKNANPTKLIMHVDSIHGERAGGTVDDIYEICGSQVMDDRDILEECFKRIIFFEGFEEYDRVVMDFPYAYFDDIERMRVHLAQWGVELLDEKRLITLNYVETVPYNYYNTNDMLILHKQ